jgi:Flp pilus assembly protein TadD
LSHLNRLHEAIHVDQEALTISPKDPRTRFAYGQLILASNRNEAMHQWEMALKLNPRFTACATALAHERIADGKDNDAVKALEPVLKDAAGESGPWVELARAKLGLKDLPAAKDALDKAEGAPEAKKSDIEPLRKRIQKLESARGKDI